MESGERSLTFFQFHLHFNNVFQEQGGFDIVIGNPPYVRQEQLGGIKPALQQEYDCYTGTADLYVYFYERGFHLLRPGGSLTYISSNKYFRSGYGEKLRNFLAGQATVQHLIDFGDAPVFEAIAYPSIILVTKAPPTNHQTRALTWKPEQSVEEFASVFRSSSFLIAQKELTPDGWRLESPAVLRLLEKLRGAGQPLGEYVNGRFYYGIKTGFNEAFVVDRATRDRLIAEHPSSAEVLKPFLRGRDVKRWRVEPQDLWLIFTRCGIDIKKYPAIHAYLSQYKKQLIPGIPGGRKPGSYKWYEIQDNIAYWQEFEQPKIAYPNICKRNEFAWDESGYYINQKAFIIPKASKYLLGVLNSSVAMWLFDKLLAKLQNGFYEPSYIFMKDIPIPNTSSADSKVIAALVQKCLDAKGQSVAEWEAEIDDRVGHLYGLTVQEIAQLTQR